jgi:hypothetical protein
VGVAGPDTKLTVRARPWFTVDDAPVHETSKTASALHTGLIEAGTVKLEKESTRNTLWVAACVQPLLPVLV